MLTREDYELNGWSMPDEMNCVQEQLARFDDKSTAQVKTIQYSFFADSRRIVLHLDPNASTPVWNEVVFDSKTMDLPYSAAAQIINILKEADEIDIYGYRYAVKKDSVGIYAVDHSEGCLAITV